jgi:P-type Cu+ transporter
MATSKTELKVQGMTCEGCVRGIEKKLSKVAGVQSAHVDLASGKATVEYDDTVANPAQLVGAIEQIGYSAQQ